MINNEMIQKLTNARIGVLGIGYIGSMLIKRLSKIEKRLNLNITPITRKNINIVEGATFDYFFNCAGNTGNFRQEIIKTLESNISLNIYLLQNLKVTQAFVSLSSTRIYGFQENPNIVFDESYSCKDEHQSLDFIYNGAKKLAESLLLNMAEKVDYRIVSARLSNVYGAYTSDDLDDSTFVKILLKAFVEKNSIEIRQNEKASKDYIHIADAIEGIIRCAVLSKTSDCYNICSGQSLSVRDWTNFLSLNAVFLNQSPPSYSRVSCDRAIKNIGFMPIHFLNNLVPKDIILMNDPIKKFDTDAHKRMEEFGKDKPFKERSRKWVEESMSKQYVYNFYWMGRPIIQYPQDVFAIQELIWSVKPDLIIETGIAHGGSIIFSASMLELLGGDGEVLGIDIDIREHNRKEIENHPMYKRITMMEGSSIDEELVQKVKSFAQSKKNIMVILDSNHTHEHVMQELKAYAPLVSVGSYLIVLDTFVEDMPPNFFDDRPWDVGDNPKTAVWEFLKSNDQFIIDKEIDNKLLISVAPDGYLKRIK